VFETSSKKYDWMNRIIAVGIGHRPPDGPFIASSRFFDAALKQARSINQLLIEWRYCCCARRCHYAGIRLA